MKESTQKCGRPPPPPKPNMKNKDFVKWSRAESCKKEDSIISTDWHEKLKKTEPFNPVYDNIPLNMVYLLSGEYGRIWQKERDEWYSNVFVPKAKEKDFFERRKKIRQKAKEAKKAAEINIKERKERRAKELEAKAKAEAERLEKLKAKVHKPAANKHPVKTAKKEKDEKKKTLTKLEEKSNDVCPKGWKPVELTLQCECSGHAEKPGTPDPEERHETSKAQESQPGCTMCEDYIQQLKDIHDVKNQSKEEPKTVEQPSDS